MIDKQKKQKVFKVGCSIGTIEELERIGIKKSHIRKCERARIERKKVRQFKKKFKKTYPLSS